MTEIEECKRCGKPLTDIEHCDVSESESEISKGLKLVDSRVIALIASKRKFNVEREIQLIEKSRKSKCRCKHWTQTNPCYFHTCRHTVENHYGLSYGPSFTKAELEAAK